MSQAKAAVEQLVEGREVTIYVPMLEDAAVFEGEMRELGVRAVREISVAAE